MASVLNMAISDLLDDERITLVKRIRPLLEAVSTETDLFLPEIISAITMSTTQLSEAMTRVMASKITGEMKITDTTRDNAIDLIDDAITYFSKKSQPLLKEAALQLGEAYDTAFGGISLTNNTLETNRIDIFLELCKKPEIKLAIETLGLEVEHSDLVTSNPEYEELRKKRAELKESDSTPLLQPSRRAFNRNMTFLENYLEFKISQESEIHRSLADELSIPCGEIMAVARSRQTRKMNEVAN